MRVCDVYQTFNSTKTTPQTNQTCCNCVCETSPILVGHLHKGHFPDALRLSADPSLAKGSQTKKISHLSKNLFSFEETKYSIFNNLLVFSLYYKFIG